MQNVIIGVVGVVVLILLGWAAYSQLGPRFLQSANTSRAAAATQVVTQISAAANMSNLQNGLRITPTQGVLAFSTSGFLKSVPVNPTTGGPEPVLVDAAGNAASTDAATFVAMVIGTGAGTQDAICAAIAKQSGQQTSDVADDVPVPGDQFPSVPLGCIKITSGFGDFTAGQDVAFAQI